MKFTIVTIGKIKEPYLKAGIAEFTKRLRPYCQLQIVELPEERMPDKPSEAEKQQVLEKEAEKMLRQVKEDAYVIALDLHGKSISSEELAEQFSKLALQGSSHITFIIGGPFGLSDRIRKAAKQRISFGRLTFTHQMIRLILTEQIYRAIKIQRNEPYHW